MTKTDQRWWMSRCNPWTSPVQPRGLTHQASPPPQASLTSGASRTAATMCSLRGPAEVGRSLRRSSRPRTSRRERWRRVQPGRGSSQSSSKIPKVRRVQEQKTHRVILLSNLTSNVKLIIVVVKNIGGSSFPSMFLIMAILLVHFLSMIVCH